jgi:mandelate racemase
MDAAGLAGARGMEMSSHLFPEVSAHLLAATPTAHWLEYVDWADKVVEQPLEIVAGNAIVPDRPGHGMVWDAGKLAKLERIA